MRSSFDCILVAPIVKNQDERRFKKQEAYINELILKKMKVTVSSQSQPGRGQEILYAQLYALVLTLH